MTNYTTKKITIALSGKKYQKMKRNHNYMKMYLSTWSMELAQHLIPNPHLWRTVSAKKGTQKEFLDETRQGNDSYLEYRRCFQEPMYVNRNVNVDNRWVVPYNPWLLLKYDCHINVEVCSSIKNIKYLHKYVYKSQKSSSNRGSQRIKYRWCSIIYWCSVDFCSWGFMENI